jgi:hypothetical protein
MDAYTTMDDLLSANKCNFKSCVLFTRQEHTRTGNELERQTVRCLVHNSMNRSSHLGRIMARFLLRLGLTLSIPSLALACTCYGISSWQPPTIQTSLARVDAVFRGTVLRKLKNVELSSGYVVRVHKIFKGCSFNATDRILVTTATMPSFCGLDNLKVNATFVFSAYPIATLVAFQSQLPKVSKVQHAVAASICDVTRQSKDVSSSDLQLLNRYDNSQCVIA